MKYYTGKQAIAIKITFDIQTAKLLWVILFLCVATCRVYYYNHFGGRRQSQQYFSECFFFIIITYPGTCFGPYGPSQEILPLRFVSS
jgi:hypothetical protein